MATIVEMGLFGLGVVFVYMTTVWLVSLLLKNSSIVDIFWGIGFALLAGAYYLAAPAPTAPRQLLLVLLVCVWGLRLALHIGIRNHGKGEDYRYRAWREQHGSRWWWRSFFQVFMLQGVLLWIIGLPLLVVQAAPQPANLTVLDILGLLVWLVGFVFEALGDWQLTRFKADLANKGKVMRSGLWQYTRHPNYFGDATVWWGYYLLTLSVQFGFTVILSPILMTTLLMRVSGVALLERGLKQTKPEYGDYVASTNAFFPGLPRRK